MPTSVATPNTASGGFQQHVAKPVSPEELVAVVAALVSPRRDQG